MSQAPRLPVCSFVVAMVGVGCSGTRLYERANGAASAGDYAHAVAYDALAANDRAAQPGSFDQQYATHAGRYAQQTLTRLGAPSPANADAQVAEVRALIAWARAESVDAAVLGVASARLGELAHVRWPRVRSLVDAGTVDEAVVLGRAFLVDAPSDSPERTELAELEARARGVHEANVARLAEGKGHDGIVALHERLARQMGGQGSEPGRRAEAALARKTGMTSTVDASNAGDCNEAVNRLKGLLPNGGDVPVHFGFRFTRCTQKPNETVVEDWRTETVTDEVEQTVSDLVSSEDCHATTTGTTQSCAPTYDGRQVCVDQPTYGQECGQRYTPVEHTERVRRTRNVQVRVVIHSLTVDLDYAVTMSADLEGQHFEADYAAVATSGVLRTEDASPSMLLASAQASDDLAHRLDGATRALATFARKTESDRLREEAKTALDAGDEARAQSLYVESSVVQGAPTPELRLPGVTLDQLTAALADRPYVRTDSVGAPVVLPSIPQPEILEDAHERTDSLTLSAEARAGYSGGLFAGASRYLTPAPGESTTGGFVGLMANGAEQVGSRFTGGGVSFHLFGNFDGRTSSFDFSMDLGLGLKLGQFYLLPVGGAAIGTSTHASPSSDDFRPNAALRATAFDAVYGGQLTFALPYPINLTFNAQLVRTAPVPLDEFKQWTTRLFGTIGYHLSKDVDVLVFGRYWELDTESVRPLQFFGGNGRDHRLVTLGLGIGGSSDKFLSGLFGSKAN